MAHMIRKQIHIKRQHDAMLKRLVRARGVSEGEIIRQAIEQQANRLEAWERAKNFILTLRARNTASRRPRSWKREDAYEERMKRYERRTH
ncbi:MAG: ribbon-helix-helix protein, CopG family [Chloroflexi bacterium]|nr:ribbon-helix-helix protein, CopG family [Chloroflexota bacterium]